MKRIVIEEKDVNTLKFGLPLIDHKAKGKGIVIELEKMSKVQIDINVSMIQVYESGKKRMTKFDVWLLQNN